MDDCRCGSNNSHTDTLAGWIHSSREEEEGEEEEEEMKKEEGNTGLQSLEVRKRRRSRRR